MVPRGSLLILFNGYFTSGHRIGRRQSPAESQAWGERFDSWLLRSLAGKRVIYRALTRWLGGRWAEFTCARVYSLP